MEIMNLKVTCHKPYVGLFLAIHFILIMPLLSLELLKQQENPGSAILYIDRMIHEGSFCTVKLALSFSCRALDYKLWKMFKMLNLFWPMALKPWGIHLVMQFP